MNIPNNIIIIPTTRIKDISSLRNFIDPKVVNKKTNVAKIGYALDRSLKDKTLNHIKNDSP